MTCPACHAELSTVTIGGVTLDACAGGCGGIWFDRGELAFDPPAERLAQWLDELAANRTIHADLTQRRRCPRCADSVLMRHFSSATRAVTIDECPTCAGVWLDSGELERIRAEQVSPEDRHRAMVKIFEERNVADRMALIARQLDPYVPYATWRSRVFSSAVVALYVTVATGSSGDSRVVLLALTNVLRYCALPLACIWFPDALGDFVGGRITKKSPRSFVWFFGWVVLLVPALSAILILR
jgi:Zn-finger nucleic acid-binding protein